MSKTPLTKYSCLDCDNEFITQDRVEKVELNMVCPFCQSGVQAVAGPCEDNDLYEEMGCLYPGGFK
ncbi:hypothetical protein [Peribacillus asahii]|uniref:hypothetical protein n=1 Tax=Peribacillus asahii TaxID=228899 RepID=UPI0020797B09|nr:hypothetical protein [Peribacillus asahii]USK85708.1 hypothetical protein LIT35_03310 [Peribacillus asahii]